MRTEIDLWCVINIDEKLERLELHQKTPQRPVNIVSPMSAMPFSLQKKP